MKRIPGSEAVLYKITDCGDGILYPEMLGLRENYQYGKKA